MQKTVAETNFTRYSCGKLLLTDEFAISLSKEYRNQGIGTLLMQKMITHLKETGYRQASLSVDKVNYAVRMYKKSGFEIIEENEQDYLMILKLKVKLKLK